jgi:hypothetical protein
VLGLSPCRRSRFAPFSFREPITCGVTGNGMRLIDAVRQLVGKPSAIAARLDLPADPAAQLGPGVQSGEFLLLLRSRRATGGDPLRSDQHAVARALSLRVAGPAAGRGFHQHFAVAKAFHVSPFLPRDLEYRMSFSPAAAKLGVHMADWQGEMKVFDATLSLQREPWIAPACTATCGAFRG